MRHFKKFTKTTELTPVQQELSENCSVQFIHDESGVDWYVLQKLFQPDTLKIQYDKTGLIIAADKDATKLFPLNCSVVELADTDIPDGFQAGNFTYSNGVIAPVQVDYVALATAERDRRMASVTSKSISLWKRRMIVILLMPSWSNFPIYVKCVQNCAVWI